VGVVLPNLATVPYHPCVVSLRSHVVVVGGGGGGVVVVIEVVVSGKGSSSSQDIGEMRMESKKARQIRSYYDPQDCQGCNSNP